MCVFKTCNAAGVSPPCALNPYSTRLVHAIRVVDTKITCEIQQMPVRSRNGFRRGSGSGSGKDRKGSGSGSARSGSGGASESVNRRGSRSGSRGGGGSGSKNENGMDTNEESRSGIGRRSKSRSGGKRRIRKIRRRRGGGGGGGEAGGRGERGIKRRLKREEVFEVKFPHSQTESERDGQNLQHGSGVGGGFQSGSSDASRPASSGAGVLAPAASWRPTPAASRLELRCSLGGAAAADALEWKKDGQKINFLTREVVKRACKSTLITDFFPVYVSSCLSDCLSIHQFCPSILFVCSFMFVYLVYLCLSILVSLQAKVIESFTFFPLS